MTESIVMRRVLGIEKKNRVKTTIKLEKELLEAIKTNCLDLSNVVNIAVEEWLRKKGYL